VFNRTVAGTLIAIAAAILNGFPPAVSAGPSTRREEAGAAVLGKKRGLDEIDPTGDRFIESNEPDDLPADVKKPGQWLTIGMKDGSTVRGELLSVRGGLLFLADSSAFTPTKVEIDRVSRITCPRKSRLFQGMGRGFFLPGIAGFVMGFALTKDSYTPGRSFSAILGGLGFGILGAAVGSVYGICAGIDETVDLTAVPPGSLSEVTKKLETWARYGNELPPGGKTILSPAADPDQAESVQPRPEGAVPKPGRISPEAVKSENFSRFHVSYTPRFFRLQSLDEFKEFLREAGFDVPPYYNSWVDSDPIEYPREIENPLVFFKDFSLDFSVNSKFSLGIAFETLGKHGALGRRVIGQRGGDEYETFLAGFLEGRSLFMTASYFPIPDAFLKKDAIKLTAGFGIGITRMDFYGSENSDGYEYAGSHEYVTRNVNSKHALAYLLSADRIHFFSRRWSLGVNVNYKWIPVKTNEIPIDCFYAAGWDDATSRSRHEAVHVAIPARTWHFGGLGIGLHFGLHL
jgi:hypothetical protein